MSQGNIAFLISLCAVLFVVGLVIYFFIKDIWPLVQDDEKRKRGDSVEQKREQFINLFSIDPEHPKARVVVIAMIRVAGGIKGEKIYDYENVLNDINKLSSLEELQKFHCCYRDMVAVEEKVEEMRLVANHFFPDLEII